MSDDYYVCIKAIYFRQVLNETTRWAPFKNMICDAFFKSMSVIGSEEFSRAPAKLLRKARRHQELCGMLLKKKIIFPIFENGCQDEQASTSLITGGSSGNIPFTLLGTGAWEQALCVLRRLI
jgi:hypothetical protein